jgi:hypothetical protein
MDHKSKSKVGYLAWTSHSLANQSSTHDMSVRNLNHAPSFNSSSTFFLPTLFILFTFSKIPPPQPS